MFFLFGFQSLKRATRGQPLVRRFCARCGFVSDLRHENIRTWFTLFFIPIFPVSKAQAVLTCTRCGAGYDPAAPSYSPAAPETDETHTVLLCPTCGGKLRIPIRRDNAIQVTCPHCSEQFTVRVEKS